MYRAFFQLTDLPFKSTPDLAFFYQDAEREDIVNAILYTLERGDGIIKVVGEVGSGKTTLLRRLTQRLPEHYVSVYINSPNLSSHDILFFICVEFGLQVDRDEQKFFLTKKLNTFLLEQYAAGKRPLLLIDEAQAMSIETLEEIRLLTNLETEQDKLLQMVLFGQPELDEHLAQPQIRQFQTRITHSIYLQPFSVKDIHAYLNFRMRRAGYPGLDLFTPKIAALIHQHSRGLLRDVNTLADRALLAAYSESSQVIKPHHIDVTLKPSIMRRAGLVMLSLLLLVSLAVGVFLYKNEILAQKMLSEVSVAELKLEQVVERSDLTEQAAEPMLVVVQEVDEVAQANEADAVEPLVTVKVEDVLEVETMQSVETLDPVISSRLALHQRLVSQSFLYTVQLIVVPIEQFDEIHQRINAVDVIEPDYVQFYLDEPNAQYKFYYGRFDGLQSAQTLIDALPNWLQFGRPYVLPRVRLIEVLAAEEQGAVKEF